MFNTAKKQIIPTCPSIKQSPKQSSKLIYLRSLFWRLKDVNKLIMDNIEYDG